MRKFFLLLFLCPLYTFGQDTLHLSLPPSPILKFSPFSLMDPLTSIQFALEHPLNSRISLQHELGYIIPSAYESENKNDRGWRIRNEIRFYFNPAGYPEGGGYLAPEFLFIHSRFERNEMFGRDCSGDFNCAYYQYMDYTMQKQVYALHLKIGYQFVIERFAIDLYSGLGYRHVKVKSFNKPPNGPEYWDLFYFQKDDGFYDLPSMSLGMKIGYFLQDRRKQLQHIQ
ncbi:DUF3575 domain-containing protein [Nafulsella turpanensis]|uniref:DUF3575 domain-containing protein n=1 Tax=Nafulsella turpanensis TaxID=1265690 RepID=UPI00034BF8A1|nr:DUF3575 domain-containing protein [Nafulsella turpanensis]